MDPYKIQEAFDVLLVSDPPDLDKWQNAINTLNELINTHPVDEAAIRADQRKKDSDMFMRLWQQGKTAECISRSLFLGEDTNGIQNHKT